MVADGYKDTEIGVIPIEWDVAYFEDLKLDVSDGNYSSKYPKQSDFIEQGIPFIRANNIKNMTVIHKDMRYISAEQHSELKKGHLKQGDILITTRGDIGQIALVPDDFIDTNINAQIVRIGVSKKINNKYLAYFLIQQKIQTIIKSLETGTALKQLPVKKLGLLPICIPPLKEQEKIANILSTADDKIDAIATQIEKAETLKIGLLQKLLSEGIGHSKFKDSELGKIPESWKVVELEKLLTFKNGVNALKEQYGKGYRFINVLDIINNLTIKHNDIIGLVDIDEKEFELYEVKYGDILFQRSSETRAEVGQSNVYLDKEQSATFGGFVIKGSPKQEYNPIFMNYLFKIPAIRKQITSKSGGSTRYNIGQSSLNEVVVQFPPLNEQKQIADILSTADEKLEVLRAKKEKYETLKKGLLQKLLSGEVRV